MNTHNSAIACNDADASALAPFGRLAQKTGFRWAALAFLLAYVGALIAGAG